jgi:hypothetical protein
MTLRIRWGRVALSVLGVALAIITLLNFGRVLGGEPSEPKGSITFGQDYDASTLEVARPASTFADGDEIAWSARLFERAGAQTLTLVIVKQTAPGVESSSTAYNHDIPVSNPDAELFANKVDLSPVLDGPGTYAMRYLRGGKRLAEGTFTIAPRP